MYASGPLRTMALKENCALLSSGMAQRNPYRWIEVESFIPGDTSGRHGLVTRANLFLFTDIDLWPWLFERAEKAGWSPFRTPIIWAKSDSEGLAPWGREGFRRTYELIFYATKGGRGLVRPPVDILRYNRVPRSERDYGAAIIEKDHPAYNLAMAKLGEPNALATAASAP